MPRSFPGRRNMNADVKHIVFDWNGTLLDDATIVYETIRDILAELGDHILDRDVFFRTYYIPFEVSLVKMGVPQPDADAVMARFHDVYEERAKKAELREGARAILAMAAENNLRCLILSNHIVAPIQEQLERHAITHHFAEVLAYPSRELQFKHMTKGERLRRYFAENGYDPTKAVIIGDSGEEPEIAHQQGMVGIAITGGCFVEEKLREAKPHHLIHSLCDMPAVLRERGWML